MYCGTLESEQEAQDVIERRELGSDDMSAYSFTTLSPIFNHTTYAQAINDSGEIAGYYNDGTSYHGFIYNPAFPG